MSDNEDYTKKFEDLRRKAEEYIKQHPQDASSQTSSMLELVHELEVHHTELEIQNEELRRAQQEISSTKKEYEDLYEFAPCGYLTLNNKGIISKVNLTAIKMLGEQRNRILRSSFTRFLDKGWEGTYLKARKESGHTGESQLIELKLKFGTTCTEWVLARIDADRDDEENVLQWRMILNDISSLKEALDIIKQDEEKYRLLYENMPQGAFFKRADGVLIDCNPACLAMTGLTKDQFLGRTSVDKNWDVLSVLGTDIKPEDHPSMLALRTGKPVSNFVLAVYNPRKKDYVWMNVSAIPQFKDGEEKPYQVFVTLHDITEIRQAEQAVIESEEHFRLLTELSPGGVFRTDVNGDCVYANKTWLKMAGMDFEEARGKGWTNALHPDDRAEISDNWYKMVESNGQWGHEYRFQTPERRITWVYGLAAPVYDPDGEIKGYLGLNVDISAKKSAQIELEENRSLLQAMAENYPNSYVTIINNDYSIGFTTGQEFKKQNLDPKEFIGLTVEQVFGEKASFVREQYKKAFKGQSISFELFINNQYQYYRAVPLPSADGSISRILAVVENITERKQAEERLAQTLDAISGGIWYYDFTSSKVTYTPRYYTMLGYEVDEFPASHDRWIDLLHPDDREKALEAVEEYQRTLTGIYDEEFRLRTKSGEYRWIRSIARIVTWLEDGSPELMIGNHDDITEKKEAFQKIFVSEEFFRNIFTQSPIGISQYDLGRKVRATNESLQRMLGYTGKELAGKPVIEITHSEDYEKDLTLYNELIAGKRDSYDLEKRYIRKNGSVLWGDLHVALIRDINGKPSSVIGMVNDITERKQAEEAQKESEERFRAIFDNSLSAVVVADDAGDYLMANEAASRLLGYSADTLLTMNVGDLNSTHIKTSADQYNDFLDEKSQIGEFTFVSPGGNEKTARYYAVHIRENFNLSVLFDITEQKKAEQVLREHDTFLQNIVDASPFPIALADPSDSCITFWSKSAHELFGNLGDTTDEWYKNAYPDPEYRQKVLAQWVPAVEKARESGETVNAGEYNVTCADGTVRICELHAKFLSDHLMVTLNDISERKAAEDALIQSERLYREAQAVAHIGHWELDPLVGTPVWSDEIFRIFGIDPEKGEPSFTEHEIHIYKDDWPLLEDAIERIFSDGTSFYLTFRIVRPDDEIRWMRAIGTAQSDETGTVLKVFGTAQDITKLKVAEDAIRTSEEFLKTLLEAIPVPVFYKDKDLRYIGCNRAYLKLYELTRRQLIGKTVFDINPPELAKIYDKRDKKLMESGRRQRHETQISNENGNTRDVIITKAVYKGRDGDIAGIVGAVLDVSELKKIQNDLISTQENLLQAQRIGKIGNWIWNVKQNTLDWSDELYQVFGVGKNFRLTYENIAALVHPEDRELNTAKVQELLSRSAESISFEFRIINSKKEIRHIRQNVESIVEDGEITALRGTMQDISERKNVELALKESETFLRTLLNAIPVPVFYKDNEGRYLGFNSSFEDFFGMRRDDIIGRTAFDPSPTKLANIYHQQGMSLLGEGGIQRYESQVRNARGETLDVVFNKAVFKNSEGETGGIIGAILDITELKKAEKAIRYSEMFLNETGRMGKIGGWEHDLKTGRASWTKALYDIIELDHHLDPPGVSEHLEYYPADHRNVLQKAYNKLLKDGTPFDLELQVNTAKKKLIWCRAYGEPVYDSDIIVKVRGTFQDINDRKEAEIQLEESKEQFELAMNATKDGLFDWNLLTDEIYYSPGWKGMLGYKYDELENDFSIWVKLTRPEDVKKSWEMLNACIAKERDRFEMEFQMQHKGGHWVDVLSRADIIFDENDTAVRVVGTHVDISARKRAEVVLRESEAALIKAQSIAKIGSWQYDVQNDRPSWSNELFRIFDRDQALGTPGWEEHKKSIHPDDWERIDNAVTKAALEGVPYSEEFRIIRKNGAEIWAKTTGKASMDSSGAVVALEGTVQDITEIKQTEFQLNNALTETLRREVEIRAILKATNALLVNRPFEETARIVFGECKDLIGSKSGYVALLSDDGEENEVLFLESGGLPCTVDPSLPMPVRGLRGEAYKLGKTIYDNDFMNSDHVKFMPDGHVVMKNVMFAPLIIENKVVGVMGLANKDGDYTDNDASLASAFGEIAAIALAASVAREAKEASDRKYREIFDGSRDGFMMTARSGRFIDCNHAFEQMLGYNLAELKKLDIFAITPEKWHDWQRHEIIERRLLRDGYSGLYNKEYRRKNGEVFPVEMQSYTYYDKNGQIEYFWAVVRDITMRREIESQIVSLSKFPDEDPYPVMRLSLEGDILYTNRSSDPVLEKLLTKKTKKLKKVWKDTLNAAVEYNQIRNREVKVQDNLYSLSFVPVPEHGYLNVYGNDITQLKQMQEELKSVAGNIQDAREKERLGIARELHDEIGQMLTGIKMDISECYQMIPEVNANLEKHINELQGMIDRSIYTVRRISSDLRPTILDDFGFIAALEWHLDQFENRTGIAYSLSVSKQVPEFDKKLTISLYRVFQESLTNIIRHAEATNVSVTLSVAKRKLRLIIADNGKGIEQDAIQSSKSLGLIGMRERISQFDGLISISGHPGEGTTVTVEIPLGKVK